MAKLVYTNKQYHFHSTFAEKDIAKDAGLRWSPEHKLWWTDDERKAARLVRYAEGEARDRLHGYVKQATEQLKASRATDADVDLPRPEGLEYLPYQRAGIHYATQRDNTLIADEMGLGKTIQAIGIANVTGVTKMLVICPASLRLNWERELRKWLVADLTIGVVVGDYWPPSRNVYVINYDVVERHRVNIDAVEWELLICDEAHYLKNDKARRTAAVLGGTVKVAKRAASRQPKPIGSAAQTSPAATGNSPRKRSGTAMPRRRLCS